MKIRVVDFETNGIAPPAEVIEVGFSDVVKTDLGWHVGRPASRLCGCNGPVTCETRAVHHIAPAELKYCEPFYSQPFVVDARTAGAVAIAAHHADFEGKWLGPVLGDMPMICTYKGALRVFPDAPAHGNQLLRYWLEEQGLSAVDPVIGSPAHRAGPDAFATAHLLAVLLSKASVEDLIAWTKEPAALTRIPIGKQRGAKWADVDGGFLGWMLRQPDMDRDLVWNAQREINRRNESLKGI